MIVKARTRRESVTAVRLANMHTLTIQRVTRFVGESRTYVFVNGDGDTCIVIRGGDGPQTVHAGDWIVKSEDGQCTVCNAERFAETYEVLAGLG